MKLKIYMITSLILIIDQLTKWIVTNYMNIGESIKVIPHFLYITYINNKGAAWGMFNGQLALLILAAIFAIFYIIKLIKDNKNLTLFHVITYGLLLGGIIGNLIDRIIYGHVIDFINTYIFNYDFPVFNISDMAIVVGMILIIYDILVKGDNDNAKINSR